MPRPSRFRDAPNPVAANEYPPAMFKEGGTGASVKHINGSDNGGSGSTMGKALEPLLDGARVKIKVI
ncbi:NucA/NucB deoxyribonuclease domain-containing protein [Kitasatospora aureofaciens]